MAISKLILNGVTQMDVTGTTATVSDVFSPKVFTLADGTQGTGTASGGGGEPTAEQNDVNFIDYDGTILYSYSAADFANLDAMPANPTHTGLTAQGWNWTLAAAKTYVASYGALWIGQMYVTASGKTEIDIQLFNELRSPYLGLAVNGSITIDWGDNSATSTVTGSSLTSQIRTQHNYSSAGSYTITITVNSGSFALMGTTAYLMLSNNANSSNSNRVYAARVKAVRLGNNVVIGNNAFYYCANLEYVTLPSHVTTLGSSAFQYAYSLKSVTVPTNVTTINNSLLNACASLKHVSFPAGITSIGNSVWYNDSACEILAIPSSVTSIGTSACGYTYGLTQVIIPNGVTTIGNSAYLGCYALGAITIPASVTNIGTQTFANCYGLSEIHFKGTTPPTLADANAFSNLPTSCTIYVPSGYLTTYTTAENYPSSSTYTYIVE